jgi:hypothetical protein
MRTWDGGQGTWDGNMAGDQTYGAGIGKGTEDGVCIPDMQSVGS